jgi:hypothetical protein
MKKGIKITSCFGHEFMALDFAKAYGVEVYIVPNKDEAVEYRVEAERIYCMMAPFYRHIEIVPFAQKGECEARDIIAELKNGTLPLEAWDKFFSTALTPTISDTPEYHLGTNPVLMVPQKLISDGQCGVTAQQQSLSPVVFSFLKDENVNLVLGQHFHKVNDLENVKALAKEFDMYVPGLSENEEMLGIRGVLHEKYLSMYAQLKASVGIAGTHTWILLTCFPQVPQIILYNINGVEPWAEMAACARRHGRKVYALGFTENSDMEVLSEHLKAMFKNLKIG